MNCIIGAGQGDSFGTDVNPASTHADTHTHSSEAKSPFPGVAEVQQQAFSDISSCAKACAKKVGLPLLFTSEKKLLSLLS